MDLRVVDIAEEPARLSVRWDLLVVDGTDDGEVTIPMAELAALVVSHPQVSYSQAVLARLAQAGAVFVACDDKHLPVGLMLPLCSHSTQTESIAAQASADEPTKKRVWQQLVRAKIGHQAALLQSLYGDDQGLAAMRKRVRSGDTSNVEAQAARRYWAALFGKRRFRRDPDRKDQNRHLNYGYAVLRATVGRALCGAGLHPSLGVHHHNRYDAYCLADDLMEPFRPLVDRAVVRWVSDHDPKAPLDRDAKGVLLGALAGRLRLKGESRTLFDVLGRVAASLAQVYQGKRKKLQLPEWPDAEHEA